MLQNFIDYMEARARIHAAYVWGGQGHNGLSDAQIRRMETNENNALRVIAYRDKLIAGGVKPEDIEYYDCSGLAVHDLKDILKILSYDTSANGLMGFCERIPRNEIKKGDWVFRVYTSGEKKGHAYHIGYVVEIVGGVPYVIEAKGRDDGVVKRSINASGASYWNVYGRPEFFKKEIEAQEQKICWSIGRILKLKDPYMRGEDVKTLQNALFLNGFTSGVLDGIFGPKVQATVKAFQAHKNLVVDGIVGPVTVKVLGGVWVG